MLPGHGTQLVWNLQDAGTAVGAIGGGLALARHGPVDLADPRGVGDRDVDGHARRLRPRDRAGRGVEPGGQREQAPPDEAVVLGRQVDPIQERNPLPESQKIGSGHPRERSQSRTSRMTPPAAAFSPTVDETFPSRAGSASTRN